MCCGGSAANGPVDAGAVIVKVVAAGGSVTLVGREGEAGEWQFARITIDQTEALFDEARVPLPEAPAIASLEWVDGWEAGLTLMDRYPWTRLYPLTVHPAFVERVRVAVEERLARLPVGPRCEKQRRAWERAIEAVGGAAG